MPNAVFFAQPIMSLGINDVIPGEALRTAKKENVAQAYAKYDELIAKAKRGKLEN